MIITEDLPPEVRKGRSKVAYLTRSIGTRPSVKADIGTFDIQPGDQFFLCTDGVHGVVSDQEIGETVRDMPTARDAVELLVEASVLRGTDNSGG